MVRIINEYIQFNESKEDQERFINKFGKDSFDDFQKLKQRIKNKGYSPDLTFHVKNTSVDGMKKILDAVSDDSREQEVDIEGKQIPKDTKNYKIIDKISEWTIYQPLDYISSIYCAHGGRWCTAGGYEIPEGKVKVSQAKQYFNEYTSEGVKLYYCINNKDVHKSIAVSTYLDDENTQCFNYFDVAIKKIDEPLLGLLRKNNILPPEFIIEDGVLKKYTGTDENAIIPNTVTSIGRYAFFKCISLKNITIPNSITTIHDGAFSDCDIKAVYISDLAAWCNINFTSYTSNPLSSAHNLYINGEKAVNITIPYNITKICTGAFINCTSLKSVTIPDNITDIDAGAFYYCSSLEKVIIGDGITYIHEYAFYGCNNLTVYTKNDYVIDYCKENNIKYSTNIKEGVNKNILKLRICESIEDNLYLYHATDKENLDSIMKSGLLINPPKHNWEGMYTDDGIFLALDASVAEDYADNLDNPPDEIVVLKVKLSSLDNNNFGYDWNNRCEYHDDINSCVYYKNIPGNLLSVCNVNTESSQDFDDFEGTELYEILYQVFDEEVETNKETNDYWLY